jgi:hypothetical protein
VSKREGYLCFFSSRLSKYSCTQIDGIDDDDGFYSLWEARGDSIRLVLSVQYSFNLEAYPVLHLRPLAPKNSPLQVQPHQDPLLQLILQSGSGETSTAPIRISIFCREIRKSFVPQARELLNKVALQVQPIMRNRQLRVPLVSEFYPRQGNLVTPPP